MKTKSLFLSAFLLILSFASFAQYVPDSVANNEMTVAFKGKYHGLIYELMPDKGSTDAINYVNQLARYKKADGSFDTAQVMPVKVKYKMVAQVYLTLGSNQERLTAQDNGDMKPIIKGQLMLDVDSNGIPKHLALLMALKAIDDENTRQTEQIRQAGIDKIKAIQVN